RRQLVLSAKLLEQQVESRLHLEPRRRTRLDLVALRPGSRHVASSESQRCPRATAPISGSPYMTGRGERRLSSVGGSLRVCVRGPSRRTLGPPCRRPDRVHENGGRSPE